MRIDSNSQNEFPSSEIARVSSLELVALFDRLQSISDRIEVLADAQLELREMFRNSAVEKEWFTTTELAELMGVSQYTVQARWCAAGRIQCEKCPDSGKWRIPGHEVQRLQAGGKPYPPSQSYR